MGWHLLESLLQQVGEHSTLVGKLWVTATFVFRFVIVACVGDAVYSDEQSDFKCNTETPGCGNVCFNEFSPISHLRFWAAQIIAVCTPSIIFIVYATHVLMKAQNDNEMYQEEQDHPPSERADNLEVAKRTSSKGGKVNRISSKRSSHMTPRRRTGRSDAATGFLNPTGEVTSDDALKQIKNEIEDEKDEKEIAEPEGDIDESLADIERQLAALERQDYKRSSSSNKRIQFAYVVALFLKTGFEAVFIWLQYVLYGFRVTEIYDCKREPCRHVVECFVSRPMEKTLFLWFMFVVSCLCLTLNIIEIKYLGMKKLVKVLCSSQSDNTNIRSTNTTDVNNDADSPENRSATNVKCPNAETSHLNNRDYYHYQDRKETRLNSDSDSIGFNDIGIPPSHAIPSYPFVHRYGVLLNTTPTAPMTAEVEKSYL